MTAAAPPIAAPPGHAFTKASLEADGFEVTYWSSGEGDPVVWLPGAGGPQFSYALDALTGTHRVVVVELPGLGESPVNDRTQNAGEMAATVAAIIAALDISPAHVWGTSMGGIVATHLAFEHPDVVRSLVVEAPGSFRRGAPNPGQMTPEQIAAAFNRHPEKVTYRQMSPPDPRRWELVMRIMGPDHDEAVEARLGEIQAPTLAFWGIDDGIIPPQSGRLYKERMPHCAYVLVYDAAHDVQGDRPEATAELVRDFLERGMTFVINNQDARVAT
jgi:pimeloyl-ACP methyl ester carboxylesterase